MSSEDKVYDWIQVIKKHFDGYIFQGLRENLLYAKCKDMDINTLQRVLDNIISKYDWSHALTLNEIYAEICDEICSSCEELFGDE